MHMTSEHCTAAALRLRRYCILLLLLPLLLLTDSTNADQLKFNTAAMLTQPQQNHN
jgi:hypothetical protein